MWLAYCHLQCFGCQLCGKDYVMKYTINWVGGQCGEVLCTHSCNTSPYCSIPASLPYSLTSFLLLHAGRREVLSTFFLRAYCHFTPKQRKYLTNEPVDMTAHSPLCGMVLHLVMASQWMTSLYLSCPPPWFPASWSLWHTQRVPQACQYYWHHITETLPHIKFETKKLVWFSP